MSNSNVVVYTSRNCTQCEHVIAKLSEWGVDFEERNVSENREYFKELQSKRIYGTPATFIDGEKILGFQVRKLKRTLGIPYEERFIDKDAMNFS
ncbi:glutaredoxin family protein [Halobacillus mangrovi]|uniref:NrdH-redoxin n=1 Tax=Halobacillus mangrovi TaxID=402384 RepID=A0A1W6A014_9BACI|nr:glutaredoxin family protein [Halobacillus mangrovi]ARI78850.1 NrdH-redoxin [Halobacillus mangrovi]